MKRDLLIAIVAVLAASAIGVFVVIVQNRNVATRPEAVWHTATPSARPQITTPSSSPTKTRRPVSTVVPRSTRTPQLTTVETPQPAATEVTSPPTATVIPQATPTAETPPPTVTEVSQPTTTPPSPSRQYPAPVLTGPANGAGFAGPAAVIELSWQPGPGLDAGDYYVVHIPHTQGLDQQWTRETSLKVPQYLYGLGAADRRYTWYVVVMRRTGVDSRGYNVGVAVSPESEHRWFIWSLSGGPTGGPTPTPEW